MSYDLDEEVHITKVEPADKNRLWLHCRRKNGERATVKVVDFRPHFYCEPCPQFDHPGILWREKGHKSIFGDELEKIVCESPGLVPDLRMEVPNPHEAGIPYDQRFICDTGLIGPAYIRASALPNKRGHYAAKVADCQPIDKDSIGIELHVLDYDLEVAYDEREGMPGRDGQARKPIISIAVEDRVNDTIHNWNYRLDEPFHMETVELHRGTKELDCRSFVNDRDVHGNYVSGEEMMLRDFSEWIQQRQPDILCSWHGNGEGDKYLQGFDDRYLLRRCRRKGIRAPFGWCGITSDDKLSFAGIQLFDVLIAHKSLNYLELRRNGLKNVTKEILGYEIDPGIDIMEAYREDPARLITYNMRDAEATRLIDEEMNYLDWALYNQWFSKVPKIWDIYYDTRRYNSFALRKANEEGVRLPMRDFSKFDDKGSSKKKFEGAVVQDPIPGVHENVISSDLTSLYPLMSVAANLSPEMYIPPDEEPDGPYIEIPYVGHRFRTDEEGFLPALVGPALEFKKEGKKALKEETDPKKKEEMKNRYIAVKMQTNCFTPDTEIITEEGPKNIRDVSIGDLVYSINPETLQVEIKPVIATQEEDFDGELAGFASKHTNLLVTPNHRMFVRELSAGTWSEPSFVEASEMQTGAYQVPCGGPVDGEHRKTFSIPYDSRYDDIADEVLELVAKEPMTRKELCVATGRTYDVVRKRVEVLIDHGLLSQDVGRGQGAAKDAKLERTDLEPSRTEEVMTCPDGHKQRNFSTAPRRYSMDDWLQLIGWYVSEGHTYEQDRKEYSNGNVRGACWQVGITQKAQPGQDRIRKLLEKMNIPYSFSKSSGQFKISNHAIWRWFSQECGSGARDKRLPSWVHDLSPAQRNTLLWTMMEGDGSDSSGFRYRTSSDQLKDDVVRLVVGLGYKPLVRCDDGGCWSIQFSKNKGSLRATRNVYNLPYQGKVYCVTVADNHTVLAGREGTFQWCGQSFFGVQGNPGFYLCHIPTVESITAMGRFCANIINEGSRELGYKVVGGDTDASHSLAKNDELSDILQEGKELVDTLQRRGREALADIGCAHPDMFQLEFEKVFGRAIFPGTEGTKVKKKYAGLVVAEDGEPCEPYVEITGFESKKADTPEVTKGLQRKVIKKLIQDGEDPADVANYVSEVYKDVLRGKTPVKEASPQPRCKQDPRTHDTTHYTYVAAKWSIDNLQIPIEPMERFIAVPISDVPREYALKNNRPNFVALRDEDELPEGFVPDRQHLANTYVKGKVSPLLQAAGLELGGFNEIRAYKPMKLSDFTGEEEGGEVEDEESSRSASGLHAADFL